MAPATNTRPETGSTATELGWRTVGSVTNGSVGGLAVALRSKPTSWLVAVSVTHSRRRVASKAIP